MRAPIAATSARAAVERDARLQPPDDLEDPERALSHERPGTPAVSVHIRAGRVSWARSGTTPTSVYGTPFSLTVPPMSDTSALKRPRQRLSLKMTTVGVGRLVRRAEGAARHRHDAEHVEEARRDGLPLDGFDACRPAR